MPFKYRCMQCEDPCVLEIAMEATTVPKGCPFGGTATWEAMDNTPDYCTCGDKRRSIMVAPVINFKCQGCGKFKKYPVKVDSASRRCSDCGADIGEDEFCCPKCGGCL